MKVMLIYPNSDTHYVVPPVSLGYLAHAVKNSGNEPIIIDGIKDRVDSKKLLKFLEKHNPNYVGIQVFSCDVGTVQDYIKTIKEFSENIKIIIGGAHVSGVKDKIFEDFPNIDCAFHGEAELGLKLLLEGKEFKEIPGLIWKEDGIHMNEPYFEIDLDSLGMPLWELIDPRTYPTAPQGAVYRGFPIAPILTSRGCPYRCTYCAGHVVTGRRIRQRSIKSVVDEIEFLKKEYGVKEIHIIDDTFTQVKKRVLEFCDEVKKRNLKFHLTFPNGVRLDTLDDEVLSELKKCGCYSLTLGIESGSQKILDDMKKNLKLETIKEKVALIDKHGIDIMAFFIVGYPTETKEDIEKTIKFAKSLKLKRAHFSTFLPLPGTDATNDLIAAGKIDKIDWSGLFYTKAPIPPEGMTAKELKELQRKAFLEFYLRPKIMYHLAREVRSWTHFKSLLKRSIDYAFDKEK
ncbi:radical SAM protein [archaeon]|jgi:anaerobic magnesium-protoporphyrin IX monomethyl ester cyclase|nr:radical SAM protein [archaeon]MBT4396853.1 radical SAM protein [archaeon]MBT4441469.1 radical SAM protein [archaeon]